MSVKQIRIIYFLNSLSQGAFNFCSKSTRSEKTHEYRMHATNICLKISRKCQGLGQIKPNFFKMIKTFDQRYAGSVFIETSRKKRKVNFLIIVKILPLRAEASIHQLNFPYLLSQCTYNFYRLPAGQKPVRER